MTRGPSSSNAASEPAPSAAPGAGGPLNIGRETVDRPVERGAGARVAILWRDSRGKRHDISYADLREATNRVAGVLRALDVAKGEPVFVMLGHRPEFATAMLGALKRGCLAAPLYPAFGPEPVATRINLARGRVLITTIDCYRRRVAPARAAMPSLQHVLLVAGADEAAAPAGTRLLAPLLDAAGAECDVEPTTEDDLALLHFTSGTTGAPKGALHAHAALRSHVASARRAFDLRADDVFWCTADPGWVTGTSYGLIAPLACGATTLVDEADFDPGRWIERLRGDSVSVWYTTPTALRMMRQLGVDASRVASLPRLRWIATVGERLDPALVAWSRATFGVPIHDTWWQTETGAIMIAQQPGSEVRPGPIGRPLPGVEAAVVRRNPAGVVEPVPDGQPGELALRAGWPSMFRGYLDDDERYRACFCGGWYLSGDSARRDAAGDYWFLGRLDDVVKSSGHLVGPVEVENALTQHVAVADAGVVGVPDPIAGERVKAFVELAPGHAPTPQLIQELLGFARQRLGAAIAPKEIEVLDVLPRTTSGKVLRRILREGAC